VPTEHAPEAVQEQQRADDSGLPEQPSPVPASPPAGEGRMKARRRWEWAARRRSARARSERAGNRRWHRGERHLLSVSESPPGRTSRHRARATAGVSAKSCSRVVDGARAARPGRRRGR
jgi:hypothetical protein